MENRAVRDAVLGVVSPDADPDDRSLVMNRKTTFFGSEVRRRLKGLGVVKATEDGRGRYGEIARAIDDGIRISDLISRVSAAT